MILDGKVRRLDWLGLKFKTKFWSNQLLIEKSDPKLSSQSKSSEWIDQNDIQNVKIYVNLLIVFKKGRKRLIKSMLLSIFLQSFWMDIDIFKSISNVKSTF